jgi:hypothetical protein
MARGWESKSVEEQQAESAANRKPSRPKLTPDELLRQERQQSLQLARAHITQQLEKTQNPHYRRVLEAALADLDAKLAGLPKAEPG